MPVPASAQVLTRRPDGSDPRWLAQAGHVASLKWGFAYPGGAGQFSCLLQVGTTSRDPAIQAGRQVQVYAGQRCCWDGQLDEPTPGADGWQVVAHGAGTFGAQFRADYTGATWGTSAPGQAVTNAIGRGLRWVDGGTLTPSPPAGAWLGQAPDHAADTITDMLGLICSRGGLGWKVAQRAGGNVLLVQSLPTTVTRLLVATGPVPRTTTGVVNAVCLRYQSKADDRTTGKAAHNTTWVPDDLPSGADKDRLTALAGDCGRTEEFADLSNAGVMTATGAQQVGVYLLNRYQDAAFAGPFTVAPGQYLTVTGVPVNLATEQAGEVVRLLLADYGGAVATGTPVQFVVGGFEFDDETGTAQVTPLGTVATDWAALVARRTEFWRPKGDPFGLKGSAA